MGVQTNKLIKSVLEVLKIVSISLAGWMLLIPITVLTIIFRQLVDIVLRLKYRNKYGGLFQKYDGLYQTLPVNISTVLFVKCQEHKDVFGHMKRILQEKVFDNPNDYPKLTRSVGTFAGYPYWLKNDEITVDDVLKTLEPPEDGRNFDENYLNEAAAKISDEELPINVKALWTFYVSSVPLATKNKDGFLCYPIVGNFSHVIGDGTALVELFLKLFGTDSSQNYGESIFRKVLVKPSDETTKLKSLTRIATNFLLQSRIWLELIFISVGKIIECNTVKLPDENALKPIAFSGKRHVVWATESQPRAIGMIKHIKTKENSKFTCVCITAILASLSKYFKKNSLPVPKSLTVLFTLLTTLPKISKSKPAVLDNKAAGAASELPTTLQFKNLKSALKAVTEIMTVQVRYADVLLFYFLLGWLGGLPSSLIKRCDFWKNETFVVSNVPGGTRVQVFDGCDLEAIVPVVPIFGAIGLSFALISYDNRLQIGMAVDQKLISKENAQQIVDGVLEQISLLYEECKND